MISRLTRQGGRLWLAVLVVSVLLAAATVWVLAVGGRGYVVAGAESGGSFRAVATGYPTFTGQQCPTEGP